jgi:hypothetical protein
MHETDKRALWDRKYKEGLPSLTKPDPFLENGVMENGVKDLKHRLF